MSGESKVRSVLSELKRPLLAAPASAAQSPLEEHLLGQGSPLPNPEAAAARRQKVPTVPVTFHLPVELRDRIKIAAQARRRTMLDIAVEALNEHLARNPVTEQDLRRMLGLG